MIQKLPLQGKLVLLDNFNHIWGSGKFPIEWKEGLVVPIPKPEKNPHQPENYRPITLLSCLGKCFERMVNRRLVEELETRGQISESQYGFRKGKGTDAFFTELSDILDMSKKNKKHCDIIALDVSRAYSTVWRCQICKKLHDWGIDGQLGVILQDFMEDRNFRVEYGGVVSEKKSQENGVPQGSVLSVTLFIIAMEYLFDIFPKQHSTIKSHLLVFADDITIVTTGSRKNMVRRKAQQTLDVVANWAENSGFSLSLKKSQHIHICNKKRGHNKMSALTLNGKEIQKVKSAKILGVYIDSNLSFLEHAGRIREAVSKRTNIIKALTGRRKGAKPSTLINVTNSLIVTKMLFGSTLYMMGGIRVLDKLTPGYNQAIRICSRAHRTSPILSIMAESGVLPFEHQTLLSIIKKSTS